MDIPLPALSAPEGRGGRGMMSPVGIVRDDLNDCHGLEDVPGKCLGIEFSFRVQASHRCGTTFKRPFSAVSTEAFG